MVMFYRKVDWTLLARELMVVKEQRASHDADVNGACAAAISVGGIQIHSELSHQTTELEVSCRFRFGQITYAILGH